MNPVIVTAATSHELAVLVSALDGRERLQVCGREACRGELAGWPVMAPDGWNSLELIGIPAVERNGERYFNSFPLTRWAMDKAGYVANAAGLALHRGPFVTVSTASGTAVRGEELFRRFGGICENMEGGAAAQTALLYGVDCMEVRGVSNLVEDRDLSRWDIPLAVERAQAFIMRFIGALCQAD